ncbi:hypothetical protein MMC14_003525 [Varicellaria rhodocarpa]|nr:hypothetical protein [Varicellaria rhodocarpa]
MSKSLSGCTTGVPNQHRSPLSLQLFDYHKNQPDSYPATAPNAFAANVVLPPPRALRASSSRDRFQDSSRSPSPVRRITHVQTLTEDTIPRHSLQFPTTLKQRVFGLGILGYPADTVSPPSKPSDYHSSHSPQHSPLRSPFREKAELCEKKPREFEQETIVEYNRGRIADWFRGESDAVNIGIIPSPTKEKPNPMARPSTSTSGPQAIASPPTKPHIAVRPSVPAAGFFSFLGSKNSQASTRESRWLDDETAQIDIKKALMPGGQADPFSPSSFKNLIQNAEGLLSRMQNALKQRTAALHDVTAEKEAQSEELEEAQTRVKHLKIQLDDMSAKMTEQDQAMMNLVEELAHEKQARRDDDEFRKRTIRIVDVTSKSVNPRPRVSRTSTVSHDSGFESDEDGIFSQKDEIDSPATTASTMSLRSPISSEFPSAARFPSTVHNDMRVANAAGPAVSPVYSCENCHGLQGSEAWNVVGVLKAENQGLKHRVGELESALDGCLDMVNGLG